MRFKLLSIFLFVVAHSFAQKGPQPGDIYREYAVNLKVGDNWRVTDPNASHSGASEFLPNPTLSIQIDDLDKAIKAEVLMDIWGGHSGTKDRRFRFNDSAWINIPLPTTLSDRSKCYLGQYNVELELPLSYLKEGENTFRGTSGGQVCNNFGWGQWGWYVMMVRVYYSEDKIHTKGRIVNPLPGDTLQDNPIIYVEPYDTTSVAEIQLLGNYNGYDEDGDGIYKEWHRSYHSPEISGHIGTQKSSPYKFQWNTHYIPDQESKSISLVARIKDTSGVYYVSESIDSLSLKRPDSLSIKMYTSVGVKENFSVRAGNSKFCYVEIDSLANAMEARFSHRTWNAGDDEAANGTIEKPLTVNVHGYKCYGKNHFYALSNVPVAVGDLIEGFNKIVYSSNTVHHGIEVLWPGPAITIRYVKGGEKVANPVFTPADSFIFKEPFYPAITTETEGDYIYYSTDGSDPNAGGLRFRGSLLVDRDMTVKARAFKSGYFESDVVTVRYFKERSSSINHMDGILNVYPNPVSDKILFELKAGHKNVNYHIISPQGITVKSGTVSGNYIPVSEIDNGLYYLIFNGQSETIIRKFVISR